MQKFEPTPPELREFLGRYSGRHPNTAVSVAWAEGALVLIDGAEPLPRELTPVGGASTPTPLDPTGDPLVFVARWGRLAGETVTFETAGDRATKLTLQTGTVYKRLTVAGG